MMLVQSLDVKHFTEIETLLSRDCGSVILNAHASEELPLALDCRSARTTNGLKFTEFKIKYHESKLKDVTSRRANLRINVPAEFTKVRDAVLRAVAA